MFFTMLVSGHLDSHWSEWFEGLDIRHLPDGNTELAGAVVDQAALFGLLNRAQNLGLTLLSILMETADPGEVNEAR